MTQAVATSGGGVGGGASSFADLTGMIADSQIPDEITRDSELPTLPDAVTQDEAEAGTEPGTRLWSPERVAEAIAAIASGVSNALATVELPTPTEALVGRVFNTDGTLVVCRRYLQPGHTLTVDWTQWSDGDDISSHWTGEIGLTFRGVISRSSDISNPVNQDVYVTPGGVWFRRIVSNIQTGWFHFRDPHNWIGEFEDETDADSQVTADGQIAEWDGGVYVSSNYVAPTAADTTYGYERARAYAGAGTGGGFTLRFAAGAPADTLGSDGDWYINTTTGGFYEKASGAWAVRYTDQVGAGGGLTESQVDARIDTLALRQAQNLADLDSAGTARTNLGLGSAAQANTGTTLGTIPVLGSGGRLADDRIPTGVVRETGATFTGLVSGLTPTSDANFATKAYVDSVSSGGSGGVTDDIYWGTSADETPQGSELTIAATNGAAEISGYSGDMHVLVARLATEADLTRIVRSDDISQTNQLGAFTKFASTVVPTAESEAFSVWVSNQALTQADAVTWTAS